MSGINVTITTSSPGVSIGGGTSVSVAVAGPTSPVAVSMVAGGSTTVPDITQLTAGDGITISTAANQFTISSYSTAQLGSFSAVKSVNGRTGVVSLQALDLTAAASIHTHTTSDIVGFTAAIGTTAPVKSVAGRTGVITLTTADVSGLAAIATSGSASDLSSGSVPSARLPAATSTALGAVQVGSGLSISAGVLSATGGGGGASLSDDTPQALGTAAAGTSDKASRADHVHAMPSAGSISGLAAVATSGSASDLSAGTLPAARLPVATADALGAIKVGSGLSIASGVLSATGGGGGGGATFVGVPTAGSATGTSGTFAADSTYLYACYSTNNWLRVQRAEWRWTPSVPISLAVSANDASGSTNKAPIHNVSATWQAPSDTGGGLSGYVVQLGSGTTATVSAQTLSFQWSNVTAGANACTTYEASVAAFNSAGTSSFATASAPVIPNTTYPVNLYVTATPNEGAPGVTYGASWTQVCLGGYNRYELQVRLYNAENGAESNWETVGTPTDNSFTHYIGTATSNTVYEWRVRSITQVNGATTSSSIWSIIDTTPHP